MPVPSAKAAGSLREAWRVRSASSMQSHGETLLACTYVYLILRCRAGTIFTRLFQRLLYKCLRVLCRL